MAKLKAPAVANRPASTILAPKTIQAIAATNPTGAPDAMTNFKQRLARLF